MKKVLIGGIGNVLLGDDGVGPFAVRLLASRYEFDEGIELADLGTPALDLVDQLSGKDAVILVDSVDTDAAPGTVLRFGKEDIVRSGASARWDTHSPALIDTLLGADFLGIAPPDVLLVGIQAQSYDAGCTLSDPVQAAVDQAIREVLSELNRLKVAYRCRKNPGHLAVWWAPFARTEEAVHETVDISC